MQGETFPDWKDFLWATIDNSTGENKLISRLNPQKQNEKHAFWLVTFEYIPELK